MIRISKSASTLAATVILATATIVAAAAPASAIATRGKASVHQTRPLYDMAPQGRSFVNSDDPSLTGGGSLGYNQNIYNW
jgi:hypothetical protein